MRVADYIAQRLTQESDTVFMLAGGGAMFLNDALSWCEGLHPVFCHHEQTCAMAAEAYARFNGKLGVVNVTTGPGGINAINGVFGAWTDSIPMIVISGQVKRLTTLRATGNLGKLRQLGDQEVDIISLVKPITKRATFISQVDEIPFILEESILLAKDGRPGPVWIDIPIDIQLAEMNPEKYFMCNAVATRSIPVSLERSVNHVLKLIDQSSRPVFLVGSAVRSSGAQQKLIEISRRINVPICTTWTAVDFIDHKSAWFGERPGVVGTRAGNLITQKSDLIIVMGSRLPIRQVSYNWENFGRNAIKVGIDVDPYELSKPMVALDVLINADVASFINLLWDKTTEPSEIFDNKKHWIENISLIKKELPVIDCSLVEKGHSDKGLNPYLFIDELWRMLNDDEIVACADASASVIPFQIASIRGTQRLFTNAGSASMVYEIPAAIGAAFANPGKRIICIAGDGSIMLNIQELETIQRYALPIKVLVLNNDGYLSIRLSQKTFFGREKGAGPDSGLSFPKLSALAKANSLSYCLVNSISDYEEMLSRLNSSKPEIIEICINPDQSFQPKLGSYRKDDGTIVSDSLEYMSPHLPKDIIDHLLKS